MTPDRANVWTRARCQHCGEIAGQVRVSEPATVPVELGGGRVAEGTLDELACTACGAINQTVVLHPGAVDQW